MYCTLWIPSSKYQTFYEFKKGRKHFLKTFGIKLKYPVDNFVVHFKTHIFLYSQQRTNCHGMFHPVPHFRKCPFGKCAI